MRRFFILLLSFSALLLTFCLSVGLVKDVPIAQALPEDEARPFPEGGMEMAKDFFAAQQLSPSLSAWLYIPNVCYMPVMYLDNSYYLDHNYRGEWDKYGTPFINTRFPNDFSAGALLIHGHNFVGSNRVFSDLLRYKSPDFFEENPLIQIFDGKTLRYYKPYTVFALDESTEALEPPAADADTAQTESAVRALHARSLVRAAEPKWDASMLYFSTCDLTLSKKLDEPRLILGAYETERYTYRFSLGTQGVIP